MGLNARDIIVPGGNNGSGGGLTSINISAGSTSNNLSALTFSNGSGVSFGLNGSVITATVKTDYQSSGAYLTTARASTDAIGLNSALTANGVSVTANSSGLSLNFPAFLTTAMQSNAVTLSNAKLSAGTLTALRSDLTFADSNGLSWGLETNGVLTGTVRTNYQSAGAYLTTAMLSNAATISNINLSGGATSANRSNWTFADSNGISWGVNTNGSITATVATNYQSQGAYLTTADLSANSSKYIQNWKLTGNTAGTTSSAQGTDLWLSGGNGITISGNSKSLVFSVGNYLTTAMVSNGGSDFVAASAAFAGTNASGTIASNGISVSVAAPGGGNALTIQDSATTLAVTKLIFSNGGGVSFGVSTAANLATVTATVRTDYLTTAMASNAVTLSNIKLSAGSLTANRSDLTFADSNGVSWGLNTNGVITATVATNYQSTGAYLTTAMQSNAVTISNIKVSAGAASNNLSALVFSNGNGVSFGLNGSTITASASGGGGYALQYFEADDVQGMGLMTNITAINTIPIFIPFILKGSLTNNSLILQVSRSTSGSNAFTLQAALYTYSNSTQLNKLDSLQAAFSGSNTGSFSGLRYLVATGWGTNATALTPGAYVLGLNFSANGGNTASMNYSLFGGIVASAPVGYILPGSDQNNTTNTSWGVANFWGRYTVGSAAFPTSPGQSDILANFSGASQPIAPWFILRP